MKITDFSGFAVRAFSTSMNERISSGRLADKGVLDDEQVRVMGDGPRVRGAEYLRAGELDGPGRALVQDVQLAS